MCLLMIIFCMSDLLLMFAFVSHFDESTLRILARRWGLHTYSVVQLFQPRYCQEFFHAHAILEQELHKIDSIVLEGLHHCLVQGSWWPLLAINEYFRPGNVDPVPRECQAELFARRQVLRFEQSGQNCLVQFLCFTFWSICYAKNGYLNTKQK